MSVSVICGNLHDSMVNQANKGLLRLFLCLQNWYRQMKSFVLVFVCAVAPVGHLSWYQN